MLALSELQARMAAALVGQDAGLLSDLLAPGVGVDEVLATYRANIEAAAANALSISHPTVVRLVGLDFFNYVCRAFLRETPPRSGWLSAYGAQFPAFLRRHAQARILPYLPDVARFDRAIDRVANSDRQVPPRCFRLNAATALQIDPTLEAVRLRYPADEIRTAIETDEDELARIDTRPRLRWRALWRSPSGVTVRGLSPDCGRFLTTLLSGRGAAAALDRAIKQGGQAATARIVADLIGASFARIAPESGEARP